MAHIKNITGDVDNCKSCTHSRKKITRDVDNSKCMYTQIEKEVLRCYSLHRFDCLEDSVESASELDVFPVEVVVDVVESLCLVAGQ